MHISPSTHSQSGSHAIEHFMSSRDAARFLKVNPKTLERKARSGEVPGYFKFNRWYFLKSELDEWMRTAVRSLRQPVHVN